MSMQENLDRLNAALTALTKEEGTSEDTGVVEMQPEDFIKYAAEQLEKCASDELETKLARIKALKSNLEEIQKNFVGPTPTPGMISISVFRDKDQKVPTKKEVQPSNASAATAFSANVTTGDREVGKGPTGQLVSTSPAPGTGFESPNNASFAKAFELLVQTVEKLNKSEEPKKEEELKENVVKSEIWPLDMNTDFGLGKTDDPDNPVWGRDGSEGNPDGYEG